MGRKIKVTALINVCYVLSWESVRDLEAWKSSSPLHFYVRYKLNERNEAQPVRWDSLYVCRGNCVSKELELIRRTESFTEYALENPLPTLDLFGGVGAFGLGLKNGSQALAITHAIEISPSAAKTYECASFVFQYLFLAHVTATDATHLES